MTLVERLWFTASIWFSLRCWTVEHLARGQLIHCYILNLSFQTLFYGLAFKKCLSFLNFCHSRLYRSLWIVWSLDLYLIPNFKPLYRLVQAEFKSILLTFALLSSVYDITHRVFRECRTFCKQNTGKLFSGFLGSKIQCGVKPSDSN